MKHYGDITKISGYEAEPVEFISFGAPCQDLSVAGKRAGMKHTANGDNETTRSGLFYEAVRIIKEMRENDRKQGRTDVDIRPRFALYENVPGALSSNEGEDWRCVLESLSQVADETAVIPRPPKGKWQNSGCVVGDGWSIAWTIRDAQFYGIPQRRRRIALVCDFAGESAGEILFKSKGVSRNPQESFETRETTAENLGDGSAETGGVERG